MLHIIIEKNRYSFDKNHKMKNSIIEKKKIFLNFVKVDLKTNIGESVEDSVGDVCGSSEITNTSFILKEIQSPCLIDLL